MFRLETYDEVASTNDVVKRALEAGEPEGLAVGALVQTAGYGRQGRAWASPAGGMYVSLLLRPQVPASQLPTLSLVAGLAVRDALASLVPPDREKAIQVKWPNDVVWVPCTSDVAAGAQNAAGALTPAADAVACSQSLAGAQNAAGVPALNVASQPAGEPADLSASSAATFRKLCGISLESHAGGICVGIGVNVAPPADARPVGGKNTPAYLADLAAPARIPSIVQVRSVVLDAFASLYRQWIDQGFEPLVPLFARRAALDGRAVRVENLDGSLLAAGVVQGVDVRGRLLVIPEGAKCPVAVASGEAHVASAG